MPTRTKSTVNISKFLEKTCSKLKPVCIAMVTNSTFFRPNLGRKGESRRASWEGSRARLHQEGPTWERSHTVSPGHQHPASPPPCCYAPPHSPGHTCSRGTKRQRHQYDNICRRRSNLINYTQIYILTMIFKRSISQLWRITEKQFSKGEEPFALPFCCKVCEQ